MPGTERDVVITMADGTGHRGDAVPAGPRCRAAAVPARGAPLSQGRPDVVVLRDLPAAARRVRVRRVPGRRAGHRVLGRRRDRRVPRGGAVRPAGGDRLARGPGLVRRRGRHVGDVVLRLQLPPARVRAATGAQGDLRDLRHRRPLDRRRPLARRCAQAGRPGRLLPLHDADVRASARARRLGRRLARGVGAAPRDPASRGCSPGCARTATVPTGGTARSGSGPTVAATTGSTAR